MLKKILSNKGIKYLLKNYNLKNLAKDTDISYETLKNYSAGRTDIDSISIKNAEKLTHEFILKCDAFSINLDHPMNIIISPEIYEELITKYRIDYNPHKELAHLLETFEYRVNNFNKRDKFTNNVYFLNLENFQPTNYPVFFSLSFYIQKILSIGLAQKIQIILCDNYTTKNDEIVQNLAYNVDFDTEYIAKKLKLDNKRVLPKIDKITDAMMTTEVLEHKLLVENTIESNLLFHALRSIKHVNKYENFDEYVKGEYDYTEFLKNDKDFNKKISLIDKTDTLYQKVNDNLRKEIQYIANINI